LHAVPALPSVVVGVTSRGPLVALEATVKVASACVPVASTTATAVVVTPVPATVILTPLERPEPVTRTVCVVPAVCEVLDNDVMVAGDACPTENRQPQVFWLPSDWVTVGW
jgi:hypothetical protein